VDFNLSPEEAYFQRSCRDFLERACPPEIARELAAGEDGERTGRLRRELATGGWNELAIAAASGDATAFVNLGLFSLEGGRVLLPGFYRSAALVALAVGLAGTEPQRDRYLALLAGGLAAAAPAEPPRARLSLQTSGSRVLASGRQPLLANAGSAELLLLFAGSGESLVGVLVPAGAAGVGLRRLPALGGEPVFEVTLEAVELPAGAVLDPGARGAAKDAWERWFDQALALLSLELAGGARKVVELTAEYVKQRHQFGRPLGAFQAVQHHLANMLIDADGAHAAAVQALWAAAHGRPAARETSTAKLWAGRAYRSNTVLAHQLHGGAGYVREADLHLYSERALAGSVSLGTREDHLRRLWAAGRD